MVRMLALPQGAAATGPTPISDFRFSIARLTKAPGKKLDEMFGHADRSHARSAAAVRNAKRLVQIQMANIGAVIAGTAKTDLRIQVRAVHVNLAAVRVNDVANFANRRLEDAVR